MTIYVVRHGQTINNKQRKVSGKMETPLTQLGIEEAKQTKEDLKNVNFDVIISSPLSRAIETAKQITNKKIIIDERLIERDYGLNEGKPIQDTDPKELWDYNKNITTHKGESVIEILNRISDFINDMKNKYPEKTLLIVTHSGVARAIHYTINPIPNDGQLDFNIKNCEYKKYEI